METSKERAWRKQAKKRSGLPRIQFFCDADEKQLAQDLAIKFGSEKAAVVAGLKLLAEQERKAG